MKSPVNSHLSAAIALLFLLSVGIALSAPVAFGSSSTPPYPAQGFNILSIAWGTPSSHAEAGPRDTDVPLTLTLQYIYSSGTAISTSGTLKMSGTGFSSAGGGSNSTTYYYGSLTAGSLFELTFYLNLNSSLKVGNHYSIPLTMLWSAILSNSSIAPETYLIQSTTIAVTINGDAHPTFETSRTNLTSGQVNDLNFTVFNNGTGYASNILAGLTSQQVGIQSTIPKIENLSAGSSETFPLEIYVPESAAGSVTPMTISATYTDPYGNNASTTQVIDLHSSAASEPRLVFSAGNRTLVPGQTNNISVTLTNVGSENASEIVTTISDSAQSLSTLVDFPTIPILSAGSSYTATVSVYVSSSAAGQPATLTFSSTYLDPHGTSQSANQDAGFQVSSSSVVSSDTFSITTLSDSVIGGSISAISYLVKNTGSNTVYSPDYTFSSTQPIVVAGNSSFSSTGTSIAPGQSQIFTTDLTASPSSTAGIYSASLGISFTDRYGTTHNQSYSVAIMLSGSIELVVQNEVFTQNATGITVTGNLLDEGSASAYYSFVAGQLNGSDTSGSLDYVGEIDPNSPVPFTVTIPYQALSSSSVANVTLLVQLKNSLGQSLNSSSSSITRLKSISQIVPTNVSSIGPTTQAAPSLVELGLILTIVLVAAGVGVVAVIRRRQSKKGGRQSSMDRGVPGTVS